LKLAIFGLGYVGTTTAACLLRDGHEIVGIDVNPEKVAAIGSGKAPVSEAGVADLLRQGFDDGRLSAISKLNGDIDSFDAAIICVGTPSRVDGKLDLGHVLEVTRQIGLVLRQRSMGLRPLLLIFRSTVTPGTMDDLVVPVLTRITGEKPGGRYDVAFNPEFLREGTAVADYLSPPKIVIGERVPGITERLYGMYDGIDAPVFEESYRIAEMTKFADNSFHALKVAFANEIGRIAVEHGMPPKDVARLLIADTKLNISANYLMPGGPFGGSCLPKDIAATLAMAREAGLQLPLLSGAIESNRLHSDWLVETIRRRVRVPGPILLLGLTFKSGTDDLRDSPLLEIAERLLDAGYDLAIFDPDLDTDSLLGANFAVAVEHRQTALDCLIDDPRQHARRARIAVLGKPIAGHEEWLPANLPLIDITSLEGLKPAKGST
jgi:GDP-mannose 6-dehydrogenase